MTQPIKVLADKAWVFWGRWVVMLMMAALTGLAIPAFRAARAVDGRITNLENHRVMVVDPFVQAGDRFTPADGEALKNELLLALATMQNEHVEGGPHGDVLDRLVRLESGQREILRVVHAQGNNR